MPHHTDYDLLDKLIERNFDALYEYFLNKGDMPYGVAKARDGDPYEWISEQFETIQDLRDILSLIKASS